MTTRPSGLAQPASETMPAGAGAEAALGRPRRLRQLSRTDKIVIVLMIGIPILVEAVLIWWPAVASIILSFSTWNGVGGISTIQWIGLVNYRNIFDVDPTFWPALWHNMVWLVFLALIATPAGILLAVVLDRQFKNSKILQSIFFMPVMLSLALVGVVWQLVFSPDQGLVNGVFGTDVDWFGNPSINLWVAMVAASWKHVGYIMILYLAGLKGVDPSLREAASIDGATERQTFLRVIFPALRPINIVIIVITVIEGLRAFDIVWIINKGTNGLELLSTIIVNNMGAASRVGYASALAVILLVVALVPIITYLSQAFKEES